MNAEFRADKHPVVFLRPHLTFPYAWAGHIPFAYLAIDLLRPRLLVELGSDSGNSYLAFCQAISKLGSNTQSVAIDSWEGDEHARHYGDEVYDTLRTYHDPRYGTFSRLFRSYFDEAVESFVDGSIDLLHIDGLHTYEAVRHDFETWLPKLSNRGVVLLHDTEVHERGFGVSQLLRELSERYATFNFLHSNGLGIVAVGAEIPVEFSQFMQYALASPEAVRGYFEALAETIIQPDGTTPAAGDVVELDVVSSLYYRLENEPFDDHRVLTRRIAGEEGTLLLRFVLEEGVRPDYIRLDPADVPGVFHIERVVIGLADDVLMPLDALSARLGHVSGNILPGDGASIGLVGSDTDPYVELSITDVVRKIPPENPLVIEVSLRIETLLRDPRLWKIATAQLSSLGPLRDIAQTKVDIRVLSREIQRLLSAHNDQHSEHQRQLDELRTREMEASVALERLKSREADLQRQVESLRLQQVTDVRLEALESRLVQSDAATQNSHIQLMDWLQQCALQQNAGADQRVAGTSARLQAIRDELQSHLQAVHLRLEAIELRFGETNQVLLSQLTAVQGERAAQQGDIRDRLVTLTEIARQSSQEHAQAIAHLHQQSSKMMARQLESDTTLAGLAPQLGTLATLCTMTAHQVQQISSQQAVTAASLDALNTQLRELNEFQRRSFMVRLRQRISKKHPPGV